MADSLQTAAECNLLDFESNLIIIFVRKGPTNVKTPLLV